MTFLFGFMTLGIVRIHYVKSNKSDKSDKSNKSDRCDRQGRGKPCPYILATRGRKGEADSGVVLFYEDGVLGDG